MAQLSGRSEETGAEKSTRCQPLDSTPLYACTHHTPLTHRDTLTHPETHAHIFTGTHTQRHIQTNALSHTQHTLIGKLMDTFAALLSQ